LHRSLQITPVIVVDYNTASFEPVTLLYELKNARDMKINKCVWQLGDNNVELGENLNLRKYSDDLKTLKILCESVKKDHHLEWDVAAVGSSLEIVEKLPFEVVGYDLKK
jgi:hypothetical protein